MTHLLPRTASPTGFPADGIRTRIRLARFVLAVERITPALWPGLGFAGLYLAAALFGLFQYVPWLAQSLLLAAAVTATALSLALGFERIVWPGAQEGARRLERDSGLAHRPISERDDVIAGGASDPFAQALWQMHRARMAALGALRVAPPRASLAAKDPKGLRWFLLVLLAAGLVVARTDVGPRLLRAFDSGVSATVDGWITPPAYTALGLMPLAAGDNGDVAIPEGSVVALRVHGAPRAPGLATGRNAPRGFRGADGEYAVNAPITADAHLSVRVAGHIIARWRVHAVPDMPPSAAFVGVPSRTERAAVKFTYKASDDYGVTSLRAIIRPRGRAGAPGLAVPLTGSGKALDETSYVDLTGHPYAGLMVEAQLAARDAAGHTALSKSVTFRLPARVFTDPLARAIIEQRQNLASAADAQTRVTVAVALDALAIAPDKFYADKINVYIGLRTAYWMVRAARTAADIDAVENLLWQMAVSLEQNGLLDAAAELRRLQALLTQAFAQNAPQEVIDALLDRYNQAMKRYMDALAANPQPPNQAQQQQGGASVTMGEDDIQKMLDLIHKLSQAGQREKAAQMLAVLQNMLENMHARQSAGGKDGKGSQQSKEMNDAIGKLGNVMGKQRALLDKTFRQQQGQGNPKDGGAQGLARQQQQLQDEVGKAMGQVDPKLSDKVKNVGEAMRQSRDALQKGDLDNAKNAQQKALSALAAAAQDLAQQAMKQAGQQGGGREDPLGRKSGANPGDAMVKIPDMSALARARAILEELRRRAGEMARPQEERDYIDRLLKSF